MTDQQTSIHLGTGLGAVVDALQQTAPPTTVKLHGETGDFAVVHHRDQKVMVPDFDRYRTHPLRASGRVVVRDVESFCHYVLLQSDGGHTTWAMCPDAGPHARPHVVCVLNDHQPEAPGWRDWRAVLAPELDPDFREWLEHDGKPMAQGAFAEFIEDRIGDIADPPGATLMDLATTFEATKSADFRSGVRLDNGQTQITYVETIEARAGASGQLTIPPSFTLALAPFAGDDPVAVTARLRYRLADGSLRLFYKLDRPDRVLRDAFSAMVDRIAAQVGPVYMGNPGDA